MSDREWVCWVIGGTLAVLIAFLTITAGCERHGHNTNLAKAEAEAEARVQVASEIREGLTSLSQWWED